MALGTFVFNCSKGREIQFFLNVENNSPAGCAIGVMPLLSSGIEVDDTLNNADTITALLSGTTNEATDSTWARKELTAGNIAQTLDDTANTYMATMDDQSWLANSGSAVTGLVVFYSPDGDTTVTGDGTNIPITAHAWPITPDGSDITADVTASGVVVAS